MKDFTTNTQQNQQLEKTCLRCKERKELSHFYKDKRSKDGKQTHCKECSKKYQREYKEKTNKIHNKEYFKKWHKNNPNYRKEQYKKNRMKELEYNKKWRSKNKNKEKDREKTHRWRQRVKNSAYHYCENDWSETIIYFNNECCYCGAKERLERDHFIPLSKGGSFTKGNIVPACRSCNASKQDKFFEEWYLKQPFYDEEKNKKIHVFVGMKNNVHQLSIL